MPAEWPAPTARIAALQRVVQAMHPLATGNPEAASRMASELAGDPEATVEFCEAVGASDALTDALAQVKRDGIKAVPRG